MKVEDRQTITQRLADVGSDHTLAPSDQGPAIVALVAVVVLLIALAKVLHFTNTLAVIGVIAAVVMLHEAGHYVTAKLGGMKVTEFFLGFGPRLWSVRRGETDYGIKALPLGGYVRIVGMNNIEQVPAVDEPRTYRQQSFPRRFAVAVAGSTVHFVLAILAAWSIFAFAHTAKPTPVVAAVPPMSSIVSPAERAGFEAGDRIISYDGHATSGEWSAAHTYIQQHIGTPITFVVQRTRNGQTQRITLVAAPVDGATTFDQGAPLTPDHVGILGIDIAASNYSLVGSISHGVTTFWDEGIVATVHGIGAIFSPHGLSSISHQVASTPGATKADQNAVRPSSVIGIVHIADQTRGWVEKMWLFMVVNAMVGLINLFPLLPFDGGHVVIAVYERIRSRRGRRYFADVNKMLPYSLAMVVLLGFVFLSSMYLDITHPITLR